MREQSDRIHQADDKWKLPVVIKNEDDKTDNENNAPLDLGLRDLLLSAVGELRNTNRALEVRGDAEGNETILALLNQQRTGMSNPPSFIL